jgi:hypothetical protein
VSGIPIVAYAYGTPSIYGLIDGIRIWTPYNDYDLLSQGQGRSMLPKAKSLGNFALTCVRTCGDSGGYDWLLRVRGQGY